MIAGLQLDRGNQTTLKINYVMAGQGESATGSEK
jgi:hypothetical protein